MSKKLVINLNKQENQLITFCATELLGQNNLDRGKAVRYLALKMATVLYNNWIKQQQEAAVNLKKEEEVENGRDTSGDSSQVQNKENTNSKILADETNNLAD